LVKIVIPVEDENGRRLSNHFGRAPYFAWFQVENREVVDQGVTINDSSHFGGVGLPPERMMALGADVVITTGMGVRAIQMFQENNVAVLQARSQDVAQTIADFIDGRLKELTEGCLHSHQHEDTD